MRQGHSGGVSTSLKVTGRTIFKQALKSPVSYPYYIELMLIRGVLQTRLCKSLYYLIFFLFLWPRFLRESEILLIFGTTILLFT